MTDSTNKIVFLIDTSTRIEDHVRNQERINAICLSCLRLLTFLSSKTEKSGTTTKSKRSNSSVKWGYKFYSAKSLKTKVEFHKFYDFKLKYFEEFEHEVRRRFEPVSVPTSTVLPSVCLSKALTELLSDFPWEGPDITSPVKGRKGHKHVKRSKNFIYMFSNCPRTTTQLKSFTGKKVPDGDVFLDSILPPSLYQEFCYTAKLTFNWIDTGELPTQLNEQTADLCSVQIVESAVCKAGGHVFPVHGVIQSGSPYYVDIGSLLVEDEGPVRENQSVRVPVHNHSHILPVSTILEHLHNSPTDVPSSRLSTELTIGTTVIHLDMVCSEHKSSNNRFTEPLTEETDLQTVSATSIDQAEISVPATLRAYSFLEQTTCHRLLPDTCYLGSETRKIMVKKHAQNSEGKGKFRCLLSSLATRSSSLVLVCESTGQFMIMDPLTMDTACIYPLSRGNTLALEKLLLSHYSQHTSDQASAVKPGQSCDELVKKLISGKRVVGPSNAGRMEPVCGTSRLDGKLMDRWHIPGRRSSFRSLIQKLNLRINELEFLNKDETGVLKQLQKAYKLEKKPPGVQTTSTLTSKGQTSDMNESKLDERFELPQKGKPSRASISRAEMILSKSKEVVKVRDIGEKEVSEKTKPDREKPAPVGPLADFRNIVELKEFMASTYGRAVSGESTCVDVNVQTTVTVALHYLKQSGTENPEEECSKVLEDCVVMSASRLREKYAADSHLSTEQKIAEYQFQIILRLEMLSTLISKDQTIGEDEANDEVVGMLRTLSFMCEPGALSKFMETCLLYNYMHTIPKTLANIYDELMQPLPGALNNILSPNNSDADQSVFNSTLLDGEGGPPSARTRSHGSVGPLSNQPASNMSANLDTSLNKGRGGRKLVHHPSLAGFGPQRQIVVEKVPKAKEKSSRKRRRSGKEGKEIVVKSLFDKTRGGTKLERRQSVAVMQRTQRTPKKAAARLLFKSPGNNNTRRKSLVAETPHHKQLPVSLCHHDNSIDQSESTDVVQESPEKAYHGDRKDTPTKGKRAKALMRRSFYSAGPIKRTRNLTQYFQLADRIAGRPKHLPDPPKNKLPKLLSIETDKHFKSPEKNSSFLLSQLVFSPSPNKRTPKKLNQTPSKLLINSPSGNTRSRHQSGCSAPINPFSLFGSPKRRNPLQDKISSPSARLIQSPHGRRQSPRILVQESATKNDAVSPHKTPLKSPYCGAISSGLDSPGESSHVKVTATPTRRSVRAALFSKSPAPNRTFSPRTAHASPRSLISRFGSPRKLVTNIAAESPKRQLKGFHDNNDTNLCENNVNVPPKKEGNSAEPELHSADVKNDIAVVEGGQKTPSPHAKKAKTPESFDKWRRRKPRNHVSPAPNKHSNSSTLSCNHDQNSPCKPGLLLAALEVQSPRRKKRNLLLSPDRVVESPSKRRRTSRLDSLCNLGAGPQLNSTMVKDGSQGFEMNSPFNASQVSSTGSLDYFSAANDEVFLSESQAKTQSQSACALEDMELDNVENVRLRRVDSRDKGGSLFKKRTFERVGSGSFPCSGESDRSDSPIFFSSVINSGKKRYVSNDKHIPEVEHDEHQVVNNSPKYRQSPSEKKYSPSVSAKSLMHLINSPLMNASEKGEARSRRSLRLQN